MDEDASGVPDTWHATYGQCGMRRQRCLDDRRKCRNVLPSVGIAPDKTEVVTETIYVCREWGLYKPAQLIRTRGPSHQL